VQYETNGCSFLAYIVSFQGSDATKKPPRRGGYWRMLAGSFFGISRSVMNR
jgi:hypothetical protein